MKILVITKYKWRSRLKKHEQISTLMKTGGIQAVFSTIHLDIGKPLITNCRIDPQWYESNITSRAQDYDHVIFQFSNADGKKWGVDSGLRGLNIKDTDRIGESWVCCDENDIVRFKDGTERDKYTKTVPHEIAHELKNKGLTNLEIHDFDFHNEINNIEGFYKELGTRFVLMDKIKKLTTLLTSFQKLTLTKPTDLLPLIKRKVELVLKEMETLGMSMRVTEGYRSIERQNELYAQGRTTKGNIVTQAKGGQSLHNYGVAVDFVFRKEGYNATDSQWKTFGTVAEKHGFEWGGSKRWADTGFIDRPHVQMMLGYTLEDFQNGGVDFTKFL